MDCNNLEVGNRVRVSLYKEYLTSGTVTKVTKRLVFVLVDGFTKSWKFDKKSGAGLFSSVGHSEIIMKEKSKHIETT